MDYLRVSGSGQRWRKIAMVLVACLVLLAAVAHLSGDYLLSRFALTTGPNGTATPAALGTPFERVAIPSRGRRLDSYVVSAEPSCGDAPVLLIYHGSQETISEWVKAQSFLYRRCVSSVVFDPSGSGDSSRPASIERIGEDAVSAYRFTDLHFSPRRIYVLGHSLGNGVMLEEIPNFPTPPRGVIVASTYSSLRNQSTIRKHLLSRILVYVMPDWWNNVQAVKRIHIPLLVIQSDTDRVNLIDGGQAVYKAANQPKAFAILHGFAHKVLYQNPSDDWWAPVCLSSMRRKGVGSSKRGSVLRVRTEKSHRVK